jgi:hypothetical protein
MSIFKTLFGRKPATESGWAVKPAAERPAAWDQEDQVALQDALKSTQHEPNPFLDDKMLDTIQLEADTTHEDNPYQTHSWEMDPENDTRKLRTIPIGKIEQESADTDGNPYATGEHRRGWKD